MPKLGLTMTKGTILKWFKGQGDRVEKGDKLVLFETEKVSSEITSPASGVILRIVCPVKSSANVGQPVAYIGEPGEAVPESSAPQSQPVVQTVAPEQSAGVAPPAGEVRASPKAKRLAAEKGVDLARVKGTGPMGMVSEQDVEKAVQEARGKTQMGLPVKELIPLSETRRVIGKRLTSSLQSMAQVTLVYEMDASELVAIRETGSAGDRGEDRRARHIHGHPGQGRG